MAIAMRTADRSPYHNYLADTLAKLQAGRRLHLFPTSPRVNWLPDTDARVHVPDRLLTPNANASRMLLVTAEETDAEWCLFLEDDLVFCRDFLASVEYWLETHARPDRRLYAFHAAYAEICSRTAEGEWDYPIGAYYGCQAFALRREDALSAARWTEGSPKTRGFDLLLKGWARETWPEIRYFLASAPCFVQHVGRESVILPGRFHQNQSFPGEDWCPFD
jgi:hypothetical protein